MLREDDIEVGQFVTVLNGGMHQVSDFQEREMHYDLKGVPLAVLTVELPYFLIATVPYGQLRIMDTREVELMKLTEKYVREFQAHIQADLNRRNPQPVAEAKQRKDEPC